MKADRANRLDGVARHEHLPGHGADGRAQQSALIEGRRRYCLGEMLARMQTNLSAWMASFDSAVPLQRKNQTKTASRATTRTGDLVEQV